MLRSLFSAVSALRAHQQSMDVIANNVANVNTTGFKAQRANFRDTVYQSIFGVTGPGGVPAGSVDPGQLGLGMRVVGMDTIMQQGSLQNTGRQTDLAIQGNGYFIMTDGSGGLVYTRDGSFSTDALGRLVNASTGWLVQGGGGPITIPPTAASFTISPNGTVTSYDGAGVPTVQGVIQIATFPNPSGLQRLGNNFLAPTAASGAPTPGAPATGGRGELVVGVLEMSNVDLAMELSRMIITQRGFQANTRAVTTTDEMLQEMMQLKR
ncbi:MAG: flagellar hook-basal body complex protein [Dehalococcoidia bacterium]|nr:flagellar hook-basal body complex protein [Dehalococcoidia bacterium]